MDTPNMVRFALLVLLFLVAPAAQAACSQTLFADSFEATAGEQGFAEVLSLAPGEHCAVTAGNDVLLIKSALALPNELLEGGELLIGADGIIQCAGCDCSGEAGYQTATVLNCPFVLTTPGFINAHEHLTFQNRAEPHGSTRFDHRHDWREGDRGHTSLSVPRGTGISTTLWGEIRQLLGGATTVIGAGSASGMLRNLDRSGDRDGLGGAKLDYNTFPLDDSNGTLLSTSCDYDGLPDVTAGEVYHAHLAMGIDDEGRNEFLCATDSLLQPNLQHPGPMLVGALGITAADLPALSQLRASVVWSPRNDLDLYGMTAPIPLLINAEIPIVLGTDWVATGSMNLQRELACAQEYNTNALAGALSEHQLLAMVTSTAADEAGVGDQIGRLAPGYFADITLFDASESPGYAAALNASPEDVVLTLKAGKPLHGIGAVIDALGYDEQACESMGAVVAGDCLSEHRVCLGREGNGNPSYAQLHASNDGNFYPLYFCEDQPPDEPACVAARDEGDGIVYTGIASANDPDGDGIPSATDLCPTVFSPPRPVDGFIQADSDDDGIGDFCDFELAPSADFSVGGYIKGIAALGGTANITLNGAETINATADGRFTFLGELESGQSYSVSQDNPACTITNATGLVAAGDVTDIRINCPLQSSTIYEIKQQLDSGEVALENMLVTACNANHSYNLQTIVGDIDYAGTDFSGIYIFDSTVDCISHRVGDRVDVTRAITSDFFGEIQLSDVTLEVVSRDNALPDPVVITAASVAGNTISPLNAVLVEVQNVEVTSAVPSNDEFIVDTDLAVIGRSYVADPFPEVGATYQFIRGPLAYSFNVNKIAPRDATDLADPVQ